MPPTTDNILRGVRTGGRRGELRSVRVRALRKPPSRLAAGDLIVLGVAGTSRVRARVPRSPILMAGTPTPEASCCNGSRISRMNAGD